MPAAGDMAQYRTALLDWLACAARGAREPAALAARDAGDGLLGQVVAAGAAGHVLDFDDTYEPGLAHLSAPVAPAALALAAACGATVGDAVAAYAAGFEAVGAVSRASHPALYDGGWHPTAVCGGIGAAVTSARLLGLEAAAERSAVALALLRAGGLRSAFGSDGKALQVGMAAASGVEAARLAAAGARLDLERVAHARDGFEAVFGARFAEPEGEEAIGRNWIKAYPCCLQSHSAIEAALAAAPRVDGAAAVEVVVHPVSRRAAALDAVTTGLEAKFSIPYLTAFALRRGAPLVESFDAVDAEVAQASARVSVRTDPALHHSEAILSAEGVELTRVQAALGSPQRPMDAAALAAKVRSLAGTALDGALDDPARPAGELLQSVGL